MSLLENPITVIDSFRNLQHDVDAVGRTTGTGTDALDGFAVTNDITYPIKRYADDELRLQCNYGTGTRIGYAFDGANPVIANKLYQTKLMGTSGQLINWVASANAFYGPGTLDPINLNNGPPSSSEASVIVTISDTNATLIQSATTVFAGAKCFSIWVKSYNDIPTSFDLQITSGTWVNFTATKYWQRFFVNNVSGPALPGIRVPNLNNGLIMWGPQVNARGSTSFISPHRQTVGLTPVNGAGRDYLISNTANSSVGTFLFKVSLRPLETSDTTSPCSLTFGNATTVDLPIGFPYWFIETYTFSGFVGSTLTIFDSGGFGEAIELDSVASASGNVKFAVSITDALLQVAANGVSIGAASFEVAPATDNIYVDQGIHAHLISVYRWKDPSSLRRLCDLSR